MPVGEVAPLRGLVLAGGASRRMGRDKAAIVIAGSKLLDRAVALLIPHIPHVHVSVRPDQAQDSVRRNYPLIVDALTGIGPAAGLIAAHEKYPDAAWLVVACDMPFLSEHEIAALLAARGPGKAATAWRVAGQEDAEPLCAIYEPGTLAAFAAHLKSGGNPSPKAWLRSSDTHLLSAESSRNLLSVNSAADIDSLQS